MTREKGFLFRFAFLCSSALLSASSLHGCGANSILGSDDPAAVTMPPPSLTPEIYRPQVNEAIGASVSGDADKARRIYNDIIARDPNSAEAEFCRAEMCLLERRNKEAIDFFSKALSKNPQLEVAYHDRGNAYSDLGLYDKAITDYSVAMLLGPGPVHWLCRARAYVNKEEWEKAIKDANVAISKDPAMASAYVERAEALAALHRESEALADYSKAISLADNKAVYYCYRGRHFLDIYQPDKAALDFAEAIKQNDGKDGYYYYWLGRARLDMEDFDRAAEALSRSIELAKQKQDFDSAKSSEKWLKIVQERKYDFEHAPKEKKYQWAIACSAILFSQNRRGLYSLRGGIPSLEHSEDEKSRLVSWWGIHSRQDLLDTLKSQETGGHNRSWFRIKEKLANKQGNQLVLSETLRDLDAEQARNRIELVEIYGKRFGDRGLMAWDLCRCICLIRWGYDVGFLTEDECYTLMMPYARKLQANYTSWQQLGEEYLVGRNFWSKAEYENGRKRTDEALARLLHLPTSPWVKLPWKTNLE
ncbi:MAG: DUF1266 domain-containing protein [Candidatus Melainabacteria bacterium]|nr:DUF1266 domain-containing protein [Candidatus Melainabacteria bacterium]